MPKVKQNKVRGCDVDWAGSEEPGWTITILFNIYVIAWWLEVGKRIDFLGAIRFEFLLAAMLSIAALGTLSNNSKKIGAATGVPGVTIGLLLVLLINVPFAADVEVAWLAYTNRVLKYAFMTLFISEFVVSPRTLRFFLFSSFLAFFKIGQEAMFGKLTGHQVWQNQGIMRLHGAQGTMFGHPNSLSGKTVSLVPFLLYIFPALKNKWCKILLLIQLVFSVNIILFTGSRTGYLTVIVMFMLMLSLSTRKAKGVFLVLMLVVFAIFATPDAYKQRFLSSFSGGHEVEGRSKEAREGLFKDSIRVFIENPFGVGLYCFPIVQRRADRRAQETHNLYTQLLAETGLQGFLMFSFFLYKVIGSVRRIRKGFSCCGDKLLILYEKDGGGDKERILCLKEQSYFLLSVATGLLVFVWVRLVLGVFGHDLLEIYWWIAAGLTVSLGKMLEDTISMVDDITFNNG